MEHSNGSADEKQWERPNAPLGTLIYRAGLLSKEKLEGALAEGARTGRRLGEVLMQKGWIEEKDLARLLAGQKALPFVSLRGRGFDEDVARLLPERICRFHTAMATGYEDGELLVAIADPGNDEAVAEITSELDQTFRLVVAVPSEIFGALDQVFGNGMPEESTNGAAAAAAAPLAQASISGGLSDDFGLRIAVAEPSAPATPVPAPVEVDVTELPAATAEPAPVDTVAPADPSNPEIRIEHASTPEPPQDDLLTPPPNGWEPQIERNEAAHVSVAFHAPAPVEPADAPVAEADEVPVPVEAPLVEPIVSASVERVDVARYTIVLELDGDDEVDYLEVGSREEAEQSARDFIARLARRDEWPLIGTRFIPPERIRAIDIREPRSFVGSEGRTRWGAP